MGQGTAEGNTGASQRQAWLSGGVPAVEEVRSGIWAIPLPLPNHPMRYTFCYALRHDRGMLLIDPGYHDRRTWDTLRSGLAGIGADVTDITGVLLTHGHPDHVGQARRVRSASGSWIALHPADMVDGALVGADYVSDTAQILAACGVPRELRELMLAPLPPLVAEMTQLLPDRELADGEMLDEGGLRLEIAATPGHTPGHVCVLDHERGVIFTGDHLLPRIRSSISVLPAAPDPLGDFLSSLTRIEGLDGFEALPSHEYRFDRVAERIAQVRAGMGRRTDEVAEAVRATGASTAWDIAPLLRWSRPWDSDPPNTPEGAESRRFMVVETLAHLRRLSVLGRLEVTGSAPERYRPTDALTPR